MDYYIIEDDVQSGYDEDASFSSTTVSEYTLGSDTSDSGLQKSPKSPGYSNKNSSKTNFPVNQ